MKSTVRMEKGASRPCYTTTGAAGADLYAYLPDVPEVVIEPGESKLISTGMSVELPKGYEMQIRPRSGLALKHSITVLNSPGTIDSDYRGIVGVILINHGKSPYVVRHGERIAQAVVAPFYRLVEFESVEADRGTGGYGSTGRG